jgi:hypothetical protein
MTHLRLLHKLSTFSQVTMNPLRKTNICSFLHLLPTFPSQWNLGLVDLGLISLAKYLLIS